jgi:hypothetical protein
MLSLLTLLHDRYLPVHAARVTLVSADQARTGGDRKQPAQA